MRKVLAVLTVLVASLAVAVGVVSASGTNKCTFYVGTGTSTQPCANSSTGSVTNGTSTPSHAVRWRNFMSCFGANFPDSSYHLLVWYTDPNGTVYGIRQGPPGQCSYVDVTGVNGGNVNLQTKAWCGIRKGDGNSYANISRQAICFTEW